MQSLNTSQFNLPTCPGPNCNCRDCDNTRLLQRNKEEAKQVEGPVLFTTKVGK